MPYRDCPHNEIEILMSFDYLNVFKPNEHTEDCHNKKPNDENFLFEIGNKMYFYVGVKIFSFEKNVLLVK